MNSASASCREVVTAPCQETSLCHVFPLVYSYHKLIRWRLCGHLHMDICLSLIKYRKETLVSPDIQYTNT